MSELNSKSPERWEMEFNFIRGYATINRLRNTLIALSLAVKYHEGEFRDEGEPYIIHPLMVCKTLILLNIERVIREWYPTEESYSIRHKCDVMYAAAILHDVIEDCNLPNNGKEIVDVYNIDKEVWKVVILLTKPSKKQSYNPKIYFGNISKDWKATLIKIADRANNCSTMEVFKEERMQKYILETQEYIYPLCTQGKILYPEFSNPITILKNLIVSICESIASILGMQEVISDEDGKYEKTIQFIEGASRARMPNTHKALYVALKLHEGQKRTSGDPFIIHPLRVCTYLMALGIEDDITCASALLHETIRMCGLKENGEELIREYGIDPEVIQTVRIVSDKSKPMDEYYDAIQKNPRALLEKLSNRVHTCTSMANLDKDEMFAYIDETQNYMLEMCKYGILHYPQYADMIDIMKDHILAICNVVETVTKKISRKEAN